MSTVSCTWLSVYNVAFGVRCTCWLVMCVRMCVPFDFRFELFGVRLKSTKIVISMAVTLFHLLDLLAIECPQKHAAKLMPKRSVMPFKWRMCSQLEQTMKIAYVCIEIDSFGWFKLATAAQTRLDLSFICDEFHNCFQLIAMLIHITLFAHYTNCSRIVYANDAIKIIKMLPLLLFFLFSTQHLMGCSWHASVILVSAGGHLTVVSVLFGRIGI